MHLRFFALGFVSHVFYILSERRVLLESDISMDLELQCFSFELFGFWVLRGFSVLRIYLLESCFIKLQSQWFICFWFSFFIHFIFVLLFIYFSFTFVFTRKFCFHPKIFALNNNVAKCDAMHIVQQKRTNNNKNVINLFRCFFFERKWFVPYVFALYFILIFSLCQ